MDFYFTDRKFNLLGIASTSSDAPISIFNDQDILSISAASRTFEGTLIFSAKERDQVKSMANYGNYILYKDENGQSIFMTIMEIEHDPKEGEHFIRAEDAGMDLINGLVDAYSATKAMTFAEYFKLFAGDTGFEIGINEISNLSRTLKWESESQTILARLLSLATQFDNAELSFSFEITGTQVVKRYVDVHKKRGADKRITLYMDKDINNIVTKANIYDLCTAIVATGGTPEGKNEPINLKGYNYKDPNGRFLLNKTTGVMQDMESVKIWSRLLSNNNPNPNAGHIQRVKAYETTDQKTLCDNVIRELEKASQPAINYETDIANLPDNVKIGDTIYLVDENEKLFLSARVLELTRCYSTNEYKATLGDYLIQDGGVSQSLKELADQLKQATTYVWIRYADDEEGNGISALPAGKTYIAIKQVLGVPTASDNPADYRGLWVKFVGEGVPGPPGENGQPTYTWLKYADDYQGTNMTDDPTGKYYIGLATNKLTATESNDPKDYKWQLVKGEDGQDAHIYQAYSWSPDGTDRFTIPYPNENLWIKSTEFVDKQDGKITKDGKVYAPYGYGWAFSYVPTLKANKTYTISCEVYNPADTKTNARIHYATTPAIQRVLQIEPKQITTIQLQITVPQDTSNINLFLLTDYPTYPSIYWHYPKIEEGSNRTIWTPAPSEDFINAYPSYVGTYTTFDDVQSTNPADYTWQRILGMNGENGKDGIAGKDGVGVSDTNITYAQSTSGTSAPTSGWTIQVPALIKGQYLWTKTTWTYTDSSTETGYTVSYNAKDGNNGTDGIAGKDGVGISSTKIEYVSSTSGTVKPTTGWTTSIPTVPAGSFLWTKTTWTYTDGTNESGYSAAKMGEKGDQGIQGPKGSDGQTYYTWLKYADTPTSGMSDSPTEKAYIGLAYNKPTATESTNYADYTWSLIKGSDGAQGPKGDNGQTLYTWIKYATSAAGAGMSDSPTGKTYIGLAYNKTTATESTNAADYSWSLIKGDKGDTGATGPQGPQGPAGPKGDRGIMGVAYMQPTQPNDTTEGATWFQTESSTSDKIIAVYTYKSGWQKKKYASATLAVESLDALSANLGEITAGIINGVEIQGAGLYSDYDYQIAEGSTVWRKGRLSMSGGYFRNDFQTYVKSTGEIQNNGFSQFSHEDLQFVVFNGSQKTKADRYLSINPYRFTMTDSRGLGGNLTFQDLYNIGKTGIPAASGWSQYSTSPSSGNFPSATRLGRMVQVSGAFKNNSTLPNANNDYVVGVLPVGFRPQMQVKYLGKGAGTTIFMVTIDTNGEISISYRLGWTGSDFGYLTNNANDIFNIAGVFSAADV
ncbi:phage minor structural protein, N-terminal region [Enterococcus saccharolyticus]|uniref:phage tail spike protein n=1 Tax=Enterococcus saccharolyticus TaxID=41997 RepID=UPI001027ED23|nr:phage tail spike protein [Enterococcus saccharolyticus]VFA64227.1 phage minor structural protein, N-terminal region [Enterococcus saccharolyticus]